VTRTGCRKCCPSGRKLTLITPLERSVNELFTGPFSVTEIVVSSASAPAGISMVTLPSAVVRTPPSAPTVAAPEPAGSQSRLSARAGQGSQRSPPSQQPRRLAGGASHAPGGWQKAGRSQSEFT
jgi:hypothetical protein